MKHSIFMGNVDVPTQNNQPVKMAMGTYEFGANLVSSTARSHPLVPGGQGSTYKAGWMMRIGQCDALSLDWCAGLPTKGKHLGGVPGLQCWTRP